MGLQCGSCGTKQPNDAFNFCFHCGVKRGATPTDAPAEENSESLILPLDDKEGTVSAAPIVPCPAHPGKNVVGFCLQCRDLVCLTCLFQKPPRHESCDEPLGLPNLLATQKPFKDQQSRLMDDQRNRECILKKLKATKADIESKSKAETTKFLSNEKKAIKILHDKFQTEVAKLQDDLDKQTSVIQKTTKTKIATLECSVQKMTVDLQTRIDEISADLQNLKAAEQKLASVFNPNTLMDHVKATKDAQRLLAKPCDSAVPDAKITGATDADGDELIQLADLTVEVTPKKPQPKPQETVPLTGPEARPHFKVGTRVERGPDLPQSWSNGEGRPGTVVAVLASGVVSVRWDISGETKGWYHVGLYGEYHLSLLHPPASQ